MIIELPDDPIGRKVTVETIDDEDVYTVTDPISGEVFSVGKPTGTPLEEIYGILSGMLPIRANPPDEET